MKNPAARILTGIFTALTLLGSTVSATLLQTVSAAPAVSWQQAYTDFLTNGDYKAYFTTGATVTSPQFTTIYLSNSTVPELLVAANDDETSAVLIATYQTGKLIVLDSKNQSVVPNCGFGGDGGIYYTEKVGRFNSHAGNKDDFYDRIYTLVNGKALFQQELQVHTIKEMVEKEVPLPEGADPQQPAETEIAENIETSEPEMEEVDVPHYFVDKREVSEAVYQSTYDANRLLDMKFIGYNHGMMALTMQNIERCIGKVEAVSAATTTQSTGRTTLYTTVTTTTTVATKPPSDLMVSVSNLFSNYLGILIAIIIGLILAGLLLFQPFKKSGSSQKSAAAKKKSIAGDAPAKSGQHPARTAPQSSEEPTLSERPPQE